MYNTNLIYSRLTSAGSVATSAYAAGIAWSYTNNGISDWFLPSKSELNELCKYARQQSTGVPAVTCSSSGTLRSGFTSAVGYWSSSENAATSYDAQGFVLGNQGSGAKATDTGAVRPIRAFGTTTSCALGGTCAVGDTGPGGGIVFYVATSAFTSTGSDCGSSCRYLEVAPVYQEIDGLPNITNVSTCYQFGSNVANSDCQAYSVYSQSDDQVASQTAGMAIGAGMANSNKIYDRATTAGGSAAASYAAGVALAYSNNGKSDWHLPSQLELNELCKYANQQTTGDTSVSCSDGTVRVPSFSVGIHWSSSQAAERTTFFDRWVQDFNDGVEYASGAMNSRQVRAVRAFG